MCHRAGAFAEVGEFILAVQESHEGGRDVESISPSFEFSLIVSTGSAAVAFAS